MLPRFRIEQPEQIEQYRWRGRQFGLARGLSQQSLYVNLGLLEQAAQSAPPTRVAAGGWDFDAFLALADRLTRRSGGDVQQYGTLVGRGLRGG